MVKEDIYKLEEATFDKDDSIELPPPDIIAYNELRSCADLFRMYTQDILQIRPKFQRQIVWPEPKQTRFIDSLVKQLPIPSMCFSLDFKSQKWQVIDGLQRMWSIIRFLSDQGWRLSKLQDIDPKLSGQPVSKFIDRNSELHPYYTRVENLTLPITVIRCDYSNPNHSAYLFTIFHRLNTGGMGLNNQEIRNCIYSGTFNDFLWQLDAYPTWMKLNKMKEPGDYRYTKQELILRFFALHDRYEQYDGRLARFLNKYMYAHRSPANTFLREKKTLFERTVKIIYESIFEGKIPPKLSISILEGVLVGISFNLAFIESQPSAKIRAMYTKLTKEDEFSEERLREGLAGTSRVKGRISTAKKIFSGQ
ncbi:MAG: DUF262 domain-containing protein [Dehalococcoidia bacterium]